jgi:hypothetical protein
VSYCLNTVAITVTLGVSRWTSPRVLKLKRPCKIPRKHQAQKLHKAPLVQTRATPDQDPTGASLVPGPTESPIMSTPSPQSPGLGAAGGSQRGEGSSLHSLRRFCDSVCGLQSPYGTTRILSGLDFTSVGL